MRVAPLISVLVVLAGVPLAADTQPVNGAAGPAPHQVLPGQNGGSTEASPLDLGMQLRSLTHAAISLPLAAVLGAALAFRPRRRGTPPRSSPVIHTQMILAIVGAMVMLIVGASLARAFGIVGAASLVRYRAKIDDPKDAGVMLSTLALGLACGVGLYLLAVFGTVFVLGFLWLIESFEPVRRKTFMLRVATKEPAALRPAVEQMLRRQRVPFELRTSSADEVSYEVLLPYEQPTDRLSNAILALDERGETAVEWEEKKAK
jgi:uncharacterized membrane protein YhiD involved in acid resistance